MSDLDVVLADGLLCFRSDSDAYCLWILAFASFMGCVWE
jgi:hypothetical protein